MHFTYLLMAIVLNASTGAEVSRAPDPRFTPTDDIATCSAAQQATGFQHVDANGTLTVYSCVALRGDTET